MAGVLLTVNGKLVTSPKDGMEYGFYINKKKEHPFECSFFCYLLD